MVKNLDVAKYRNGDTIPEVKDAEEWINLETGAWCYYNNDPKMGEIYGKLYNWLAIIDPRYLAPEGWHIPTDVEWAILTLFCGGEKIAGGKLKETSYDHWDIPNTGATNEIGFTALPGGYRDNRGEFVDLGLTGLWWSLPVPYGETFEMKYRLISYDNTEIKMYKVSGREAYSVRCIKDN